MIFSSSTYISMGSFLSIFMVFLNSIGITILPKSSIFLTIPVDFIQNPPLNKIFRQIPIFLLYYCKKNKSIANNNFCELFCIFIALFCTELAFSFTYLLNIVKIDLTDFD